MPDFIELGIYNSISNIDDINISLNNILQGKIKDGISDIVRFTINSTLGLGGFIDIATKIGFEKHDEDFGQTLAVWGVPHGPYIMLPMLGPSSLRDTVGMIPDAFLSPSILIQHEPTVYSLKFLDLISPEPTEILLEMELLAQERNFPTVCLQAGRAIELITTMSGATRAFEFGSGFGYSAYWIARGLPSDGSVVLTDRDQAELDLARDFLTRANLSDKAIFVNKVTNP